jgi:hypothetical protein
MHHIDANVAMCGVHDGAQQQKSCVAFLIAAAREKHSHLWQAVCSLALSRLTFNGHSQPQIDFLVTVTGSCQPLSRKPHAPSKFEGRETHKFDCVVTECANWHDRWKTRVCGRRSAGRLATICTRAVPPQCARHHGISSLRWCL